MCAAGHTGTVNEQRVADAVVVAAGSSQRMGGQDKLDASIAGRPVLRWAVEALAAAPEVRDVVVVAAPERVTDLRATEWLARLGVTVVAGGERRQDSVAAGIRATSADIVLVHDAARPFVSAAVIGRVVAGAQRHGAAIPVLPIVDTLKRVDEGRISATEDRSDLYRAQTPQGARRDLLAAAADAHAADAAVFPDEADLLRHEGIPVSTVAGDVMNLKVTVPEDLALARRLAGDGAGQRVAQGFDSHPFGPEDGLRLGGLLLEGAPRLHGHSDGDVVLHALCDGLLAASGEGDLGRLFPSGARATRGIDSRELVAQVMTRIHRDGRALASADVTILGARPILGGLRLDAMAESIASLAGIAPERVSVKAASGNLSGDEGAGRVVSATCLVSVGPA